VVGAILTLSVRPNERRNIMEDNALYRALIALGKSYEDARSGGWICGTLYDFDPGHAKHCANGLLTWHMIGDARYIGPASDDEPQYAEALRMAAVALVKTAPENVREQILADAGERRKRNLLFPENALMGNLENTLIDINDAADPVTCEPLLTEEMAAAWFERAFDLLAKELPAPVTPTVTFGAPR
jgi:hypothetical protein